MAGRKENIKGLFTDARTRVIVLFTVVLLVLTMGIGYYKFKSPSLSSDAGANLAAGPGGIRSIPGSANQTAQYAFLQEKQNIEQAKAAAKRGRSAIPTLVRSQAFGDGVQAVGPQGGTGALGFSALNREETAGPQQSLWIQELKNDHCNSAVVKKVLDQGAGLSVLKRECTCKQLRENGYHFFELQKICSCPDLKAAGYTTAQFKAAGYTVETLRTCGFTFCDLQSAGFSARELKDGGFLTDESNVSGITTPEAASIAGLPDGLTAADLHREGCSAEGLQKLRERGVSASAFRYINGCSAAQMKSAGFTAAQLKSARYTEAEINPKATVADCNVSSLKASLAKGVSASTIREKLGCSLSAMKAAGYTSSQLKMAGFTAAELKNAGFSAKELKDAGFSPEQLKAAGFSSSELKNAGFSAKELKDAGFSVEQLKSAGYNPEQLHDAGFSAKELKDAGFNASELSAAGFSSKALKNAGFNSSELNAAGFTPAQLKDAGYAGIESLPGAGTLPPLEGQMDSRTAQSLANEQRLNAIMAQQRAKMTSQQYQQKIQQRTNAMSAAANQVLQGFKAGFTQTLVTGTNEQTTKGSAGTITHRSRVGIEQEPYENMTGAGGLDQPAIKAGEVLFAVMDTSVNSDQPGPILATIVAGRYKGAKLIGSFNLPVNSDQMVISFNMMSVPGAAKTTSINAYAIDPNTARTALSSRTDHHYLMRYGSLFAATFIQGFGNAFQSQNTTITIGGTGGVSNTTVSSGAGRSLLENAVIGLATLGKSWGQVAMKNVNTPTTVDVFSGTGVGVLFTQDVDKIA